VATAFLATRSASVATSPWCCSSSTTTARMLHWARRTFLCLATLQAGSFFLVIGRTAEVDKRNNFLVHVVIEYGINEEVVSILDGKLPPWERRDIVRPFTKTKMLPLYVSYDLTDPATQSRRLSRIPRGNLSRPRL